MRLVLFTASDSECLPCEELEEVVREHVESGDIEKLDVLTNDDAAELFAELEIGALPSLVLLTKDKKVFAQVNIMEAESSGQKTMGRGNESLNG